MLVEGLVSTIIPVYNRPALLREAVSSVLAQTYRPIEIIIVNDGSTDSTQSVAENLAGEHPEEVIVLQTSNSGAGLAREAGRMRASGEFIQYLDSDDILLPEKFRVQVEGLVKNPQCGIAYGMTRFRCADGSVFSEAWKQTGSLILKLFPSMLTERWWGTSTPLYRRSVTDSAGPWRDFENEEDWEYDCRIALQDTNLHFTPHVLSEQRDHDADRLSQGGSKIPTKLASRCKARLEILQHARKASIAIDAPEMQTFLKSSFLVARQSAAAGLEAESRELVEALHATLPRFLSALFLTSARAFGFRTTARLSQTAYQLLKGSRTGQR